MKIPPVLLLSILIFSSCLSSSNNRVEYVVSDEFAAYNLPFSEAVIHGNTIYLSGQIGTEGLDLVEGGIKAETDQAMKNIKKVLEANGSSLENVIKCTCMLANMDEWADMNEIYTSYFPTHKPARSALGANGLALGAKVEIECMAYIN